jgi:uncharacterized protein (DUF1800 family)
VAISNPLNRADATRFLQRASFGARSGDVDALTTRGVDGWLGDQMALQPVETHIARQLRTASSVDRSYWRAILSEPDQLRRRVAYALSQILVASSNGTGSNEIANYMDILEHNAFATFRTLLEEVSLSYAMSDYLTYAGNRRADPRRGRVPDENYAREVVQLFTIGLWELDQNGTRTLSGGEQIPTYEQEDISGLARVFTGWNRSPETTNARFSTPMVMLEDRHESGPKTFLGTAIPENTSGYDSLTIALDTLASHDNVGPFVGHQLIQRLVTSNPTPAYIGRVAAVWANNGSEVRGDLGAVVRAILLDDEAWQASPPASFGKLREPVLRLSAVTRGLDVSTPDDIEGWAFDNTSETATSLGQLGLNRQVFFVSMGGFDSHNGLNANHPGLLSGIDGALSAFHAATTEISAVDDVTTFTASDFGRTLVGNGDGTDHGWGSHHIVMGGAVRNRRIYGDLPVIGDDGPDDVGSGRLIPTTGVEQYSSTFAQWMGAAGSELSAVAPNIGRFDTSDLGFFAAETVQTDDLTIGSSASSNGLRQAIRISNG